MLEPSWMGRRVTVRRVIDRDRGTGVRFGDVVGDLVGLDAATAVIDTKTGLVEVPLAFVALARLAPPSTAAELDLQAVVAASLQPQHTRRLGGWLLRADHGFTKRANSVLAQGQLGMPLDRGLRQAHRWYAGFGLPVVVQVPIEARRLLDAELGERGWRGHDLTHVMISRLDLRSERDSDVGGVRLAAHPDRNWLALYRGGEGLAGPARALLTRHPHVTFASITVAGELVAVGRGTVDGQWLGMTAVEVAARHRRRGLATAITEALQAWGRTHGATRGYVSVLADNDAAVSLFDSLGYWVHHSVHYRSEPSATET